MVKVGDWVYIKDNVWKEYMIHYPYYNKKEHPGLLKIVKKYNGDMWIVGTKHLEVKDDTIWSEAEFEVIEKCKICNEIK